MPKHSIDRSVDGKTTNNNSSLPVYPKNVRYTYAIHAMKYNVFAAIIDANVDFSRTGSSAYCNKQCQS